MPNAKATAKRFLKTLLFVHLLQPYPSPFHLCSLMWRRRHKWKHSYGGDCAAAWIPLPYLLIAVPSLLPLHLFTQMVADLSGRACRACCVLGDGRACRPGVWACLPGVPACRSSVCAVLMCAWCTDVCASLCRLHQLEEKTKQFV